MTSEDAVEFFLALLAVAVVVVIFVMRFTALQPICVDDLLCYLSFGG